MIVSKPVLLAAVLLLAPAARAADSVTVHFDDLPNRETRRVSRTTNELTMDIEGDPEMKAEMEAKGAKFPFTFQQRDEQTFVSRTEDANPDGSFVFERRIDKWKSFVRDENGKEMEIATPLSVLEGLTVRGTHSPDGSLTFVEFKGGSFDDEDRKEFADQLAKMMEVFDFNAFTFPAKDMSVGESVTTEMQASIPVPGQQPAELAIVSTHTLDKIEDDDAVFSTRATVTLEDPAGQTMSAKGKGTGEMIYSISDRLFSREETDMEIRIDILSEVPGAKMTLEINGRTEIEQELIEDEKKDADAA